MYSLSEKIRKNLLAVFTHLTIIFSILSMVLHNSFTSESDIVLTQIQLIDNQNIISSLPLTMAMYKLGQFIIMPTMVINTISSYFTYLMLWVWNFFKNHAKLNYVRLHNFILYSIFFLGSFVLALQWSNDFSVISSSIRGIYTIDIYLNISLHLDGYTLYIVMFALFFAGFHLLREALILLIDCRHRKAMLYLIWVIFFLEILNKFSLLHTICACIENYLMVTFFYLCTILAIQLIFKKYKYQRYFCTYEHSYSVLNPKIHMKEDNKFEVLFLGTLPIILGIIYIYLNNDINYIYTCLIGGLALLILCMVFLGSKANYMQLLHRVQGFRPTRIWSNKIILLPVNIHTCIPKIGTHLDVPIKSALKRQKINLILALQQWHILHTYRDHHQWMMFTSTKYYYFIVWGPYIILLFLAYIIGGYNPICGEFSNDSSIICYERLNIASFLYTLYFNTCICAKMYTYIMYRD